MRQNIVFQYLGEDISKKKLITEPNAVNFPSSKVSTLSNRVAKNKILKHNSKSTKIIETMISMGNKSIQQSTCEDVVSKRKIAAVSSDEYNLVST